MKTKKCPFCAEEILIEAIKCKHCGEHLKNEMFFKNCTDCRERIPEGDNFCTKCGLIQGIKEYPMKNKTSLVKPWYRGSVFIGLSVCVFILLLIIIGDKILGEKESNYQKPPNLPESAFSKMTPALHLKVAKEFFSKGNAKEAKSHLQAIKPTDSQYSEAQELLPAVYRKEKELQKISENFVKGVRSDQRKSMAKKFEKIFLEHGMDVYITVGGKENEIITFKYILMSRPIAYKFMNDGNFYDNLKKLGYKKAVFLDGYGTSWTYDLK